MMKEGSALDYKTAIPFTVRSGWLFLIGSGIVRHRSHQPRSQRLPSSLPATKGGKKRESDPRNEVAIASITTRALLSPAIMSCVHIWVTSF